MNHERWNTSILKSQIALKNRNNMGLTRQYLRYAAKSAFGIISSAKGGLVSLGDKNLVASATAENITIWNLKTGERITELKTDNHGEVTALAKHPQNEALAVGFNDGTIKLYNQQEDGDGFNSEDSVIFNGHKSGVTSLVFDRDGHRLGSGSRDTNIIVWDVVNECGLFRLKGTETRNFDDCSYLIFLFNFKKFK